ncbi:hypothetical protein B9Z55_028490 [Caenorhabditis nigoni]|uniref:Uncharacterized protein n=1 Tax=Caenorhabditis nigoni TaxID=1611254 RepID=A0A2G5SBR9_9PELO|nr:hypothetical protein B9Z55_028490 [Caenorhabditis nigoni]
MHPIRSYVKVVASPESRIIAPLLTVNCQANFRLSSLRGSTTTRNSTVGAIHQLKQLLAGFNGAQYIYRSVQKVISKTMVDVYVEHRCTNGAKLLEKRQEFIDVITSHSRTTSLQQNNDDGVTSVSTLSTLPR